METNPFTQKDIKPGTPFTAKDMKFKPFCSTIGCDCRYFQPLPLRPWDENTRGIPAGPDTPVEPGSALEGEVQIFPVPEENPGAGPRISGSYKRCSDLLGKSLILFFIGAVIAAFVTQWESIASARDQLLATPWGLAFFAFGSVFLLINGAVLLSLIHI